MAAPPPHRIRVVCRLRPADDAAVEVRGASLIVPKNRSVRESRDELPAQGGLRFSVGGRLRSERVASVHF